MLAIVPPWRILRRFWGMLERERGMTVGFWGMTDGVVLLDGELEFDATGDDVGYFKLGWGLDVDVFGCL